MNSTSFSLTSLFIKGIYLSICVVGLIVSLGSGSVIEHEEQFAGIYAMQDTNDSQS